MFRDGKSVAQRHAEHGGAGVRVFVPSEPVALTVVHSADQQGTLPDCP